MYKKTKEKIKKIQGEAFAFDGCHKFYILESEGDIQEAKEAEYIIYPMKNLLEVFKDACPLRFIDNWQLDKVFVPQGE